MSYRYLLLSMVAATTFLAGCSDSNGRNPESIRASVDFTAFVKQELANTSQRREAREVNELTFSFNDRSNEQAYDDLF
ncbi:hypothetical protein [Marinobacter sp. SS21]|uniref:hypothetical protein n=1 Tax=Marinobacter sp. SS21 TaxID=2979460 RepID=UPI0023308808|nr:hypothetical protein [Marinobacter sp. SS21]MDC0661139.1 hypothetical protein [Marinobacter sp. SS21]